MDLYNIPNDDGKRYRLKKFVEYQHEVPSIHYRVLGEYIKKYMGGKEFNEKKVEDKVGMVMRSHEKYKSIGLKAIKINPSKVSKDKLLGKFFKTVEKYREDN